MKIQIWCWGAIRESFLKEGISIYLKRLQKYLSTEFVEFPPVRNASKLEVPILLKTEANVIADKIQTGDILITLDEKGKEMTSSEFAQYLEVKMGSGSKRLIFLIGSASGLDDSLLQISNDRLSLSKFTLPNQMVRLVFIEQLYRAMTILQNEPYHK